MSNVSLLSNFSDESSLFKRPNIKDNDASGGSTSKAASTTLLKVFFLSPFTFGKKLTLISLSDF